jgi:ParB family chromosome partitioning protein
MANGAGQREALDPGALRENPNNPRRYFNDEQLDLLKTSIQEIGILVPLIVYEDPEEPQRYVLMDGERRWRCSLDLGLDEVPVNVIPVPSPLENLVRMFNIHSVREEWPLISIALSLRQVIEISGENMESRLAEMTGLTRSTVRRAKRLLGLPSTELGLIQDEAHLDRAQQVHREDLYLEIDTAESVVRSELPEVGGRYPREQIIRKFAEKRERGKLRAVTEFRDVGKLVKAAENDLVGRDDVIQAVTTLIDDVDATPSEVFREFAAGAYQELLRETLEEATIGAELSSGLREALEALKATIHRLLGQ